MNDVRNAFLKRRLANCSYPCFLVTLCAIALMSCKVTHPTFGEIRTGYITFEHDGRERQYLIHIPDSVAHNAPLLISMHGYTDDAHRHQRYSNLNSVADDNQFIVAYPRGSKDKFGKRFFNMGYFFHQEETVDDLGYITELTLYLQEMYQVDTARTFTSGFSNGGDMSYLLACRRPDIFKGFVSVGGLMLEEFKDSCEFVRPIPILEIRGETDSITMYQGDLTNRTGWGHYLPIEETMKFWKERNDCQKVTYDTLVDPKGKDDHRIEIMRYSNCKDNKEIWLYKVTDYPHKWPQGWDNLFFNASEEVWKFLGRY